MTWRATPLADSVVLWLLDADPSIRRQVKHDLLHAPPGEVAVARAKIATEGFGAELLAQQGPGGR